MRNISILSILLFLACSKNKIRIQPSFNPIIEHINILHDTICQDSYFRDKGMIYDLKDKTYLWGGLDSSWHFDITDSELYECNLLYGLGRETFPALLQPQYTSIPEFRLKLDDNEKCVVLHSSNETKVYPYETMTSYEIVNEIHNGHPIMIAYCVLADLGAVYSRDYCENTLTFAVSGYTYSDSNVWDGVDSFILWDRDTESLWWPLLNRAISGNLKGHNMQLFNEGLWEVLSWNEIKQNYPSAMVLTIGQKQNVPPTWEPPDASLFTCKLD